MDSTAQVHDRSLSPDEALDALLAQLISGFFVLTDGNGALSKWGDPAEMLFGRAASDALGHLFFDALIEAPLPTEGEGWKGFLERGEAPGVRARAPLGTRHPECGSFTVEATFIPVKLDEGFDFSLFLEDLTFELPANLMLMRLRQQHPVVIRALRAALSDEVQPWEGWRTAGTLIAFRPITPTPWVGEALAAAVARAEEEAAASEAVDYDPGIQGEDLRDLEDAAAVFSRIVSALERIEGLERQAAVFDESLKSVREDAQQSRAHAEAAERAAGLLRGELTSALDGLHAAPAVPADLTDRLQALERAWAEDGERLKSVESALPDPAALDATTERIAALEAVRAEEAARVAALEAAREEDAGRAAAEADRLAALEAARAEESDRLAALEVARQDDADQLAVLGGAADRVAELADRLAALEHRAAPHEDVAALAESLQRENEEIRSLVARVEERAAEPAPPTPVRIDDAPEVAALLEHVSGEVASLRRETDEARARLDAAAAATERGLGELRQHVEDIDRGGGRFHDELRDHRTTIDELRQATEAAQAGADGTGAAVDALRAEYLDALRAELEEVRQAAAAAEERATERANLAELGRDAAKARESSAVSGLEQLRAEVAEWRAAAASGHDPAELEAVRAEIEELRARPVEDDRIGALAAEIAALRDGQSATDELRAQLAAAEENAESLRAELAAMKTGFDEARQAAVAARREAELARQAAESAGSESHASEHRVTEGLKELLNAAARTAAGDAHGSGFRARPPGLAARRRSTEDTELQREERPGFDDQPQPMAVLGLDGLFRHLNPAFARLVGYHEHEFTKAMWPSVHDRHAYQSQQEQLTELATGQVDRVPVQSTYMHGQGLMVPIVGEIRLVRDDKGDPEHLLLVAEEQHARA